MIVAKTKSKLKNLLNLKHGCVLKRLSPLKDPVKMHTYKDADLVRLPYSWPQVLLGENLVMLNKA